MTGEELKQIIKDSGIKLSEILDKSGIKQRTLYNLYEKQKIEQHFLDKLSFLLPNVAKSEHDDTVTSDTLSRAFKLIEMTIAMNKEIFDAVKKDNELYRKIIDKGLEKDAISFDVVKAGLHKK